MQPFHLAIPVHDLDLAREFYGSVLGLTQGRESRSWIDYSLYGHQVVVHLVSKEYRGAEYFNPVDRDYVPVPHFGVCLTVSQFHELARKLEQIPSIQFVVKPHLRFKGQPGEQWTLFFRDPSNNSLEFKAMTNPANLFARYVVVETTSKL
jgi:extradiol dioxygenase family protein